MSYLGLETVKPIKPMKRGDLYLFPITTIDQIVTDEETNERLSEYLDKNFGMDLLWQNASPTSVFAEQSIALDLSQYDKIQIDFKQLYTNTSIHDSIELNIGEDFCTSYVFAGEDNYVTGAYRAGHANNEKVTFLGSYVTTVYGKSSVDSYCIPLRIYGIKGVR